MFSLLLGIILLVNCIAAQLVTNSHWNSNVTNLQPDRVDAASFALSEAIARVGPLFGRDVLFDPQEPLNATSAFYTALANFDIATQPNPSRFQNVVQDFKIVDLARVIGLAQDQNPDIFQQMVLQVRIRDIINYGYTAIRGYVAYNDSMFLKQAKTYWELANNYTVSEKNSQSGKMPTKNFTILSECKGAVFQNFSQDNPRIDLYEVALFSLLSAQLADSETPPNTTYIQAAKQSLDLVSSFTPLNLNSYIVTTGCGSYRPVLQGSSTIGYMIEALSILAPKMNESDSMVELLQYIISSTLNMSTTGWPGPTGVLQNLYHNGDNIVGADEGDMYFVRGLAEAYRRVKSLPVDLQRSIKVFLGVQYNAIRDNATSGDNVYGRSWKGPPSSEFDVYNQAAAAQVLIDGIGVFEDDSSPQETPVPMPGPTPSSHTSPPVKVIIGSTIGGLVFLMLLGAAVYFVLRRRREQMISSPNTTPEFSSSIFLLDPRFEVTPFVDSRFDVTPFIYTNANDPMSRPPHWHTKDRSMLGEQASTGATVPGMASPLAVHFPTPESNGIEGHDRERIVGNQVEIGDTIPDLVRIMYQRLWGPDGQESPPDYHSQSGQT
ncbi:glycoside hydrolase family 76 protein [Moniliophthora roreri MCA 2997]|uniref:Glycoside hydrolase family 76 protein n=2 Tax=Moniliophthora roreri TaxID=221103 RepID=V2YFB0_MONRO|nr:glycoside hydrolase family 76 protein [Moniliophthora roreri MCA 2997]